MINLTGKTRFADDIDSSVLEFGSKFNQPGKGPPFSAVIRIGCEPTAVSPIFSGNLKANSFPVEMIVFGTKTVTSPFSFALGSLTRETEISS